MNFNKTFLLTGALISCLFIVIAVAPVSAYNPKIASDDLRGLLLGLMEKGNITRIETVANGLYGTKSVNRLNFTLTPDHVESRVHNLNGIFTDFANHTEPISSVTVTIDYNSSRISYLLSPVTSRFEPLALPIPFNDSSSPRTFNDIFPVQRSDPIVFHAPVSLVQSNNGQNGFLSPGQFVGNGPAFVGNSMGFV